MTGSTAAFVVEENLETFSLIWLDADVNNSEENLDAQQQLRTSINYLKTFENDDTFNDYLKSTSKDDRIVLITSGRLGQTVVPKIHLLRQINSIYVYCRDKKLHETWAKKFKKVRGVIVLLDELISVIRSDLKCRYQKQINEPLCFDFNIPERSTSDLDGQYVSSQLLFDCLLRMSTNSTDFSSLVTFCESYYKDNDYELDLIKEFEKTYSSNAAIWWYTKEACFYRLMNKALRTLHIDLLYLFGFFIRDLHKQLDERKCATSVVLYRGQLMSKDEIDLLANSIGNYIAINSYFSTTNNENYARQFLNYSSDLEKILFKIQAESKLKSYKSFADISSDSYFPNEAEFLFEYGSIFQLRNVSRHDHMWTVELEFLNQEKHDLTPVLNQMKNEYCTEKTTNILSYGDVLFLMSKYDHAEKYYRRFLDTNSSNCEEKINCYHALGSIECVRGKYEKSLEWHLDALAMRLELVESTHPSLASSYDHIAIVHRKNGNYQQALVSYKKSLLILQESSIVNDSKLATYWNSIGNIYEDHMDFRKAKQYYEEVFQLIKQSQTIDCRVSSETYDNLGSIYKKLEDYRRALEYYEQSYAIKRTFLASTHSSIEKTRRNIQRIRQQINENIN